MTNLVSIITAIHLAALSQIESGDNDRAIGPNGEVSRYQIKPSVWAAELSGRTFSQRHPENQKIAAAVALEIWQRRVNRFMAQYDAPPTPRIMYLLWHRPAHVFTATARERERATRFANLVLASQPKRKTP